MGGALGAVVWSDLTLADNRLVGFEVELDANCEECAGRGYLDGALIIGRTPDNYDPLVDVWAPHGLVTARSERQWIRNVWFASFDFSGAVFGCTPVGSAECTGQPAAAVGACSLCASDRLDATDSGARTTFFEGIRYETTGDTAVPRVIRYTFPGKAIFKDVDCSLWGGTPSPAGPTAPCWLAPAWKHLTDLPECHTTTFGIYNIARLGGMYCSSPIRRMAVYNYSPRSLDYKPMHVMRNDDSVFDGMDADAKTAYLELPSNYARVDWRRYQSPSNHWVVPMVPGHKYRIVWGDCFAPYDFDAIRFQVTQYLWGEDYVNSANPILPEAEGDLDLSLPFRDYRESVNVVT